MDAKDAKNKNMGKATWPLKGGDNRRVVPHRWTEVRVIHGPVILRGAVIRAIEARDNRGGVLRKVEKWSGSQWCGASGFGWRTVSQAPLASLKSLSLEQVPSIEFPAGYQPLGSSAP
jgi:hypothetical protein